MLEKIDVPHTKVLIHELYNLLYNDGQNNRGKDDITDVLLQVYKTIDQQKNPARFVSKLVTYIYSVGFNNHVHFDKEEESLVNQLGVIAQKSGWNGLYEANYNFKSEFFNGL